MFTLSYILGLLSADIGQRTFLILVLLFLSSFLLLSVFIPEPDCHDNVTEYYWLNRNLLRIGIVIVSVSFLIFGYVRESESQNNLFKCESFDRTFSNVYVEGKLGNISSNKDGYQLTISVNNVSLSSDEAELELQLQKISQIIVNCYSIPKNLHIGDIICSDGSLSPCLPATNEGQFDSEKYYELRNIQAKLYSNNIYIINKGEYDIHERVKDFLYRLRSTFISGINNVFPNKEAGILISMLAGERGYLDDDIKDIFSQVGIAHILSISGLHISLLGLGLYELLLKLTKRLKFSTAVVLVVMLLYGILTGFSVSTVRAYIMLLCMLPAKIIGRAYDSQSAASFSALLLLMVNPLYLSDSGFQMSYFAVFGIFAGNIIKDELEINNKLVIYILPCLSAQLAVFPVLLNTYYSFSPYSIIANILLVPLMSVIIFTGLVSGIVSALSMLFSSSVFLIISQIFAGPAYYLLKLYEKASDYILQLPYARIVTGKPSFRQIVIYYIIFFVLIFLISGIKKGCSHNVKKKYNWKYALVSIMVPLMFICFILKNKDSSLNCTFLDVGQGLGIHISCAESDILIDGGSSNKQSLGKYVLKPYLYYNGVSRLDCCFVTHTDKDHVSGLKELIADDLVEIGNIYVSRMVEDSDSLVQLAEENSIPVTFLSKGDRISVGDIQIEVLSPDENGFYSDDNSGSLVFIIKKDDFEILITGDSGFESEKLYVDTLKEKSYSPEVLQVPHHGSKYSSSEEMLSVAAPVISVISCSKYNSYGHPSPLTLDRLSACGSGIVSTFSEGMFRIRYTTEILTRKR